MIQKVDSPERNLLLRTFFADVYVTLALAYRFNNGDPVAMKETAKSIRRRINNPDVRKVLKRFIQFPEKAGELLTVSTQVLYGWSILEWKGEAPAH